MVLINLLAGLTYCALSTLSFLGLLPDERNPSQFSAIPIRNYHDLIGWLAARQTNQLYEADENYDDESEAETGDAQATSQPSKDAQLNGALPSLDETICSLPTLRESSQLTQDDLSCAGFNGRPNKTADTCYCFWVTGSLDVRSLFSNALLLDIC